MRPRARRRLAALTAALLCVGARSFAAANAHLAHGGQRLIYAPTRPAERDADLRFAPRVVRCEPLEEYHGCSDHVPLVLELSKE